MNFPINVSRETSGTLLHTRENQVEKEVEGVGNGVSDVSVERSEDPPAPDT